MLPYPHAIDKKHRLRDRLHFFTSGLKVKQILTKHCLNSCAFLKRMILCLGMCQSSILGVTLDINLGEPHLSATTSATISPAAVSI